MRGLWGSPTLLGSFCLLIPLLCGCSEAHGVPDSGRDGAVTVDGSGTATAALTITPALQFFGDVLLGEHQDAPFVVTNTGDAPSGGLGVDLDGDDGYVLVASECADPLAPGDSCTLVVRFAPDTFGTASGVLTVSDRSTSAVARLEAAGFGPPALMVTPTPFDFGTVGVGERSAAQTFTVQNTRSAAIGPLEVRLGDGRRADAAVHTAFGRRRRRVSRNEREPAPHRDQRRQRAGSVVVVDLRAGCCGLHHRQLRHVPRRLGPG